MKNAGAPTTQIGTIPISWNAGKKRWLLTIYSDNTRKRRFFKSETDALREWKAHVRTVDQYGKQAAAYDALAHKEFDEAKRIAGDVDLREVARFYREHHAAILSAGTVSELTKEFIAQKEVSGKSARHLKTLSGQLEKFAISFGSKKVSEIPGNTVLAWLTGMGKAGYARRVTRLRDVTKPQLRPAVSPVQVAAAAAIRNVAASRAARTQTPTPPSPTPTDRRKDGMKTHAPSR